MNSEADKAISLIDVVRILGRRKWLLIICLIATIAPVLIYNYRAVPVYQGSTKVIFENRDQTAMSNYTPGGQSQANLISNQIEEMKTKLFAEQVYDEMSGEQHNRFFLSSSYSPELNPQDYIVNQIKGNLAFTPVRGTEIIAIDFQSEDPVLAEVVANATAEVLIKRNLTTRRQQFSHVKDFINQQFELVRERLAVAERSLKEFKEREKITSIENESREILQRSTQAEIVFNDVKTTKKELEERLATITEKLDAEKAGLAKNVVKTNNPLAVRLKERLVELEVTYSNLQVQGFPAHNPKMLDLKNEIEQTKQTLVRETLKINQDEDMQGLMDPFSQIRKYVEETVSLEVELQGIKAKERNLEVLLASYSRMLRQLPEKELTLVRLMRDREVNQKLYMTLVDEREKARINEASEIANIRILEPARLPAAPIRPRKLLNVIVGLVSGLFFGTVMVFAWEYFNEGELTVEDVERDLGLPVIAAIPKNKKDLESMFCHTRNGRSLINSFHNSVFFDAYNLLSFALDKHPNRAKSVMITSSIPNEGKSTVASMLAVATAQRGKRTLLIDADLRKPSLDSFFGVPREPGLTNLLIEMMQTQKRANGVAHNRGGRGDSSATETHAVSKQMIQTSLVEGLIQTFEKNLLFLPSGFIPANPVRVWSSNAWSKIFHHLSTIVDFIIIDAPPIMGVAETSMMATHVGKVMLCVAAEGVDKGTVKRSFKMFGDLIPNPTEKIVGVVLNKADPLSLYGGYSYYHRYYAKKERTRRLPEVPRVDFQHQRFNGHRG